MTRFRIVTSDGILVIYDAAIPPGVDQNREPGERPANSDNPGFVAYWNDFETESLYVFDRLLLTPDDAVVAVGSLQSDFGLDPVLFASDDLGVSRISSDDPPSELPPWSPSAPLGEAGGEGTIDDGSWQPASRELVMTIMGFGAEEDGWVSVAAPPPWCLPMMAAIAVDPLPEPPLGTLPDVLIDLASSSAGCPPPGGCGCCGDPCCIDPCSCDPCCVDPCSCDPCCGNPDPCCGVNCDDWDFCTGDSCNPETGGCVNEPINCDDGNPCTVDGCDAVSGQCIHVCDPPAGGEPCPDTVATPLLTLLDSLAEMDEALAPTLTGSCARLETDIPTLTECGPDLGAGSATGLYANGVLVSSGTAHLTAHPSLGTFDVVLQLTEGGGRAWTLSQTMRLQDSVLQVWGTVERIEVLGETTIRSGGWIYSAGGGAQEDPNSEPGFHGDAAAMLHCGGAVAALSPQDVLSFIANVASMMVYYVLDALIPYTPPTSCTGPSISDGSGQSCENADIPCADDLDNMCLGIDDLPGVSNAFKKCMKGRCGCGGSTFPRLRISCADVTNCGPCGSGAGGCNLAGSQIWYCQADGADSCGTCVTTVFHEMAHACGQLDDPDCVAPNECPVPDPDLFEGACRTGYLFGEQCCSDPPWGVSGN